MFERYTEKARRVIFFARYEASQFGSPVIETEHLLLGILRDDPRIRRILPAGAPETIRAQIDARFEIREKVSISVDLPLSNASKRVLAYAAEEADRLNHRHIGSEHLFLGLLREESSLAAKLLEPFGVKLEQFRTKVEAMAAYEGAPRDRGMTTTLATIITIHGLPFKVDDVLGEVRWCRLHRWHWRKASWKPRDCVIERHTRNVSLELNLAEESLNFELIKGGWKKDRCTICCWELFESQDDHGTGYSNGRDWLCLECYDKFWARPDFISGSYSDIT